MVGEILSSDSILFGFVIVICQVSSNAQTFGTLAHAVAEDIIGAFCVPASSAPVKVLYIVLFHSHFVSDHPMVFYHVRKPRIFAKIASRKCLNSNVCYKVFLCENFQRQSCSRTIPLSNGV